MKFTVPMRLRVEADLPAAIAAAAERSRTKPSEWLRRKIREAVLAEGVELPLGGGDDPSTFPPAAGMREAA